VIVSQEFALTKTIHWLQAGLYGLVLCLAVARPQPADAQSAVASAAAYTAIGGCPPEPLTLDADLSRRRPNEARYPVCVDQRALFTDATDRARREGRPMIVHIGAPWCPVCRVAGAELAAIRRGEAGPAAATALAGAIEISLSTSHIVGGKLQRIAATDAILAEHATGANIDPLRAIPYLLVMSPDGQRRLGRHIEYRADAVGGPIRRQDLADLLVASIAHAETGAPPPPAGPSFWTRALRKLGF
jgi:thiol-disulfide isomerase/thioredoxin